jgi:hypothetical protein
MGVRGFQVLDDDAKLSALLVREDPPHLDATVKSVHP